MKATLLLGALCALTGCSQQTHNVHLTSLPLSDLKEVNAQWSPLTRMESRYPKEAILAGQTGCSSLEYVINPAGRAEQIRVLDSSDPQFSDAAIAVLQQWQWQATPPTRSTSRSNPVPASNSASSTTASPATPANWNCAARGRRGAQYRADLHPGLNQPRRPPLPAPLAHRQPKKR